MLWPSDPRQSHSGSFAQYVAIKYAEINLVRLPDEIDFVTAASLGCRFITYGTVLIQAEGRPDAVLDFGDGTCDPEATITINGETYKIRLRGW